MQSEAYIQDYYTEIKNELLSFKGMRARISWSKESYKYGKNHIAKIDVKGKTLLLYLALDPASVERKYNAVEVKGECPTLIKIKSERKKKYAIELINKLCEMLGMSKTKREEEDYRLPYEETESLIERGLIKIIVPKNELLDENAVTVKANLKGIRSNRKTSEAEQEDSAVAFDVESLIGQNEDIAVFESDESITDGNEYVGETVEEETVEDLAEAISEIDDAHVEEFIESVIDDRTDIIMRNFGSAIVSRHRRSDAERSSFAFADTELEQVHDVVIPYTKAQYLALSRKQKKSILMNVKKLSKYRTTLHLCRVLESNKFATPRVGERLEYLKVKLKEQEKSLPIGKKWESSVQRVKR